MNNRMVMTILDTIALYAVLCCMPILVTLLGAMYLTLRLKELYKDETTCVEDDIP